jgi:beta-carotene hydroxylase
VTRRPLLVSRLDAAPAAIVTAGVALALVPFAVDLPAAAVVALLVASLAFRAIAPVHQHCHAHLGIFRWRPLNAAYDVVLVLAAGNTTAVWQLQHVRGHHQTVLEPALDPASTRRFGRDGALGRVVFTVAGDALSFTDSLRIARRQRDGARLVRRLWRQLAVQLALYAALVWLDPLLAVCGFLLPNLALRWFVFWYSWDQHHEAPLADVYSSSITRFGWTNRVFLNVGHHTAHHEKPTLHWSLLPARTERIRHRIPPSCLRAS